MFHLQLYIPAMKQLNFELNVYLMYVLFLENFLFHWFSSFYCSNRNLVVIFFLLLFHSSFHNNECKLKREIQDLFHLSVQYSKGCLMLVFFLRKTCFIINSKWNACCGILISVLTQRPVKMLKTKWNLENICTLKQVSDFYM